MPEPGHHRSPWRAQPIARCSSPAACYLALRRAVALEARPSGVVLIEEPGRALRARDVEAAIDAPVVATLALDPAVARAVDAGLLAARLPRLIQRELRNAA